jgi:hypothetical protein
MALDEPQEVIQEFVVTTNRPPYNYYDVNKILRHNLLKSAKFAVQFPSLPEIIGMSVKSEDLTFLCDSVEFPGQSLTTTEFRTPGKLKLKVPYLREQNEVTMTFYHSEEFPMYDLFANWISNSSPTNTTNYYFDEIVCPAINIVQFDEVSGYLGLKNNMSKYMMVILRKAYPLNFASMPSNWADDGYHKMTVTFFYEELQTQWAAGRSLPFMADRFGVTTDNTNADPSNKGNPISNQNQNQIGI